MLVPSLWIGDYVTAPPTAVDSNQEELGLLTGASNNNDEMYFVVRMKFEG